jgi:2-oxoglutarate ferredoxin oxidoreductase subunit beta
MVTRKDFDNNAEITWCPRCGNYSILNALKLALVGLNLKPQDVMLVSGIGQSSKTPDYAHTNGYMTLHGRALPVAEGVKLVRPDLKVIVHSGDGDGYGEGLGHMMHAARRNIGIVHIAHNNQIYGLTKGQYSPTSDAGMRTNTSPFGAIERPVRPLTLALAAGATFVARGFSKEIKQLSDLVMAAIQHRGYALVDVLQPCVTFNRINTYEWYSERVYRVEDQEGYDPKDFDKAMRASVVWGDRIPTGILYQVEDVPAYEELEPGLREGPVGAHAPKTLPPDRIQSLKEAYM